MRYIIAILLFISFGASAQTTYLGGVTTTVLNRGAFISDSVLAVPKRDTSATFASQRNVGRITVTSDSNIYYHNGKAWVKLSNQSPDLSGYVPYTGATTNVDLGSNRLKTVRINTDTLEPNTSAGLHLHNASHQDIFIAGAGGGQNLTIYAPTNLDLLKIQNSTDTVLSTNTSGTIVKSAIASTYLKKADTSTLSTRIDARVKYTDTSTMLSPYLRSATAASTYSPLAGSSSIATVGTITSGTWNGGVITGTYGGTGVANTSKTITLGGNISTASSFTTSGANALTLTTTGTTNATLPSGTTTLIGSSGGTVSSTGILFSNGIQAKWGGSGAFTIDNSSSTGLCKFNLQTGGYEWHFQYNGTTFFRWYDMGAGSAWRRLALQNKAFLQFDMSSGLNSTGIQDGDLASDGTNLYFYKSKWRILDDEPSINATAITGTSNINLTYNLTTRYVDATGGALVLTIIPTYAGQITYIKRLDASGNTVTVKMNSGNIDGAATVTPLTAQYKCVAVQWDGTNGYIIGGY